MKARGVHLQYTFELADQRGAALHNPLFDLLQAVQSHGSIQNAARALGASYRHIWGALKRWEDVMGEPLVTWAQGQPARLTPFAERLLWAETRARTRLTPHIEALRAELGRVLVEALDGTQQVLKVCASHDLALPHLRELASQQHGLHMDLRFCGSVDALRALAARRCLVAGFHVPLLHERAGKGKREASKQDVGSAKLFAEVMKPLLKPGLHRLMGCVRRTQGLIVSAGNPLRLQGLADLAGGQARFINRQPGSGTRLLMDQLLLEQGLLPEAIKGYLLPPETSHVAVAAAVASGAYDAGLGIEAAARQFGLDFIPLLDEDYFLVCLKDALEHPAVLKLRAALQDPAWQAALAGLPGYALSPHSGEVLSLTKALPWWRYRTRKSDKTITQANESAEQST